MNWAVLAMSLVSGLSTPLGAVLVAARRGLSRRFLAGVLGLASAVMATVTLTELWPLAIRVSGFSTAAMAAVGGAAAMGVLRLFMTPVHESGGSAAHLRATGWFILTAIALHDVPEGMAIGAGDAVRAQVGVLIAAALALHNIPEGMSIATPLAMGGVSRRSILLATLLVAAVTPLGTAAAIVLGHVSPGWTGLMLGGAGGAMAYVVARDTGPEAWKSARGTAVLGAVVGALLMLTVNHFFGV